MTSKATTVAGYLKELPPARRADLSKLRTLIKKVAPNFAEGMNYGLPCYTDLCAFASQKQYMAFYADPDVVNSFRAELGKLNCGKGCIRFRHFADLPLETIEKILRETGKRRKAGIPSSC